MRNTIKRIGELIRTQDNRGTAEPIFLVQQKVRVYGVSDDYTDNYAWIDSKDESRLASKIEAAGLDALDDSGGDLEGWEKVGYVDRWEFVTCCFTADAAETYIRDNRHNLREPRVYVDTLHRNDEMIAVRAFLMEQGRCDQTKLS